MKHHRPFAVLFLLTAAGIVGAVPLPVLDDRPVLQVDPGGPSAAVTALAFSPDGDTLYVAGLDKVVRVWHRGKDGFVAGRTIRVPLGPGTAGAVNAIAVSPDGKWLAVAGRAPMRGETGFQRTGVIVEVAAFTAEQLEDAGLIYVTSTTDPEGGKVLRGHRGEVRALAFAPAFADKPPLLVSSGTERDGARRYGGLRLWDVTAGKQLAERTDLPARVEPPPGVAVWHTGPKALDVRVAVAWPAEDGKDKVTLRIWNPAVGAAEPVAHYEADRYSRPLALVTDNGTLRLLVGGLQSEPGRREQGRLQSWRIGGDVTAKTVATFNPPDPDAKVRLVPDGIAAVSADEKGNTRLAAVLLRPTAADADNALALVDLETNKVRVVPLKDSDGVNLPVLAAAPRGGLIAVADAADHSVKLFAAADLLRGKAEPMQVLPSRGLTPRRVVFIDKGRGLWLSENERAKPQEGGLYFDFEKRQLTANDGKAAADTPAPGDWSWSVNKDRKAVRVRHGDKAFPPLTLKDQEVVTAVALKPPGQDQSALLAVAITDRDNSRTLILLYRPEDGLPFRLLIGHLQDVRQLAFSASRPLLASVAEDQTVCVWSLTDLDKSVGQIPGLGVADMDGKAVVHAVEAGSVAAKSGLAKGDVLEALGGVGGELRPVRGATDFLFAVSARRPGDKVEVKVKGKRDPVTLPVGRGAEGMKPLFSLLLHREPAGVGWVGWSPAGPYDASGDAAEACVGWHTNTGNGAAPVAFVHAGQHRKEYYRRGILGLLAEEGDLGRALRRDDARRAPPEPALQPRRPEKALFTKRDDEYLIREAVPSLSVGINADYALTDAHVLKWSVARADGGNVTATEAEAAGVARRDGDEWQADLGRVRWRRGEYRVRFFLHPAADAKSVAEAALTLRLQPPAPTLQLEDKLAATTAQKPMTVMDDKLTLQAVLAAAAGQKVDVSFGQWVNGREQDAPKPLRVEAGKLAQPFALAKGLNQLLVRMVNEGALPAHEAEETATVEVWLRYEAPVELPPRFAVPKFDPAAESQTIDKKTVWVVDQSRVRLSVRVEADGALVQADWAKAAGDATLVLPLKDAGKVLEFHVDLDLKAGQTLPLRFRAKSKNSDVNTSDLAVVFHPLLPGIAADALNSQDYLDPKLILSGTYKPVTSDPFTLTIRVAPEQGPAKDFKAEVDAANKSWRAPLTLTPGRNLVQAFVRNEWRGEEPVAAANLSLRYLRPPRIVEAKAITALETAVVDLPLTVDSPAGMPLRAVTVNGTRFTLFKATPEPEKEGWVTWHVVVPQVPACEDGRKLEQLHVLAHNDDGPTGNQALVKETVVAVTHKAIPKAADACMLLPKDVTERRPRCAIPFHIDSDSALVSAELRRGDDEVIYHADLKKVVQEGKRFVLDDKPEITLNPGLNNLRLVVLNAGGQSTALAVVNYLPPSVRVEIDGLEVRSDKGDVDKVLKPTPGADGEVRFPAATTSLVVLAGRVIWSDPEAKQLDAPDLNVVVLVRGCKQFPVELKPRGTGADATTRTFKVPVVLTAAENAIKVEVKQGRPDADKSVGQEALSHNTFTLACAAPATQQRLHLLVVGVNVTDGKAMVQRVLDALGATERPPGLQGTFKTPAFQRSILYRVLIGEVERGKVEAQLVEINKEIARLRSETKLLNDVILIYYQGEDVMKGGELWLKTTRNIQYPKAAPEAYAIPCRALPCEAGAQLLLLNVVGGRDVSGAGWGGDPDVGLLRYAWLNARDAEKSAVVLQEWQKGLREKRELGEVAPQVSKGLEIQDPKPEPQVAITGHGDRIVGAPPK